MKFAVKAFSNTKKSWFMSTLPTLYFSRMITVIEDERKIGLQVFNWGVELIFRKEINNG